MRKKLERNGTGDDRQGRGQVWMRMALAGALLLAGSGCSIRQKAVNLVGDALAGGGDVFASDNDPQLVRDALPFSLKLIESLLAESPDHAGLRLAAAEGFTQYSFAFVQQDADRMGLEEFERAMALQARAKKLYLRGRDHALALLEQRHPGFHELLKRDPDLAVAALRRADVPALYWSAAGWAAAISVGKDDVELVADLPMVDALVDRASALDPDWDHGAIHSLRISYALGRADQPGDPAQRARTHFARAVALTDGQSAGPYVSLAEGVAVREQNSEEFTQLLQKALAIDVDARPEWRLANLILQERARWLLGRKEDLFF